MLTRKTSDTLFKIVTNTLDVAHWTWASA